MIVKKAGGKVYGATFTAAERKAMNMEINRQIIEADKRYTDDIDAMILYTLAVHLGFGPKRLRRFYEAVAAEHDRLIVSGEMPLEAAEQIYNQGEKRASNRFPGYPVCVDSKYFFATKQRKRKPVNE